MAVWLKQYRQDIDIVFASNWLEVSLQLESQDLILLDLNMPGMSGAASIIKIRKTCPDTPLLIVSANQDGKIVETCMQAGASGYITKASHGSEIIKAVTAVLSGKSYRPEKSMISLSQPGGYTLTEKQMVLLGHIADGSSNRDIAGQMHLSEGTVKQYVSQLLRVLEVDNRTQAGSKARHILGRGDLS